MPAKYLSKSRYKIGRECPTKLYYHNNRNEYYDSSLDDPFLAALAKGGFQVGELAKIYHAGGADIKSLDHDTSLQQTKQELDKDKCNIYEPAFLLRKLFIRVDILCKDGKNVDLIEVKAKSIDPIEENPFWNKRELKKGNYAVLEAWKPYIYDVAFQTYVLRNCHPEWNITPKLMLANKKALATVDGLNQMFLISEVAGQTEVVVKPGTSIETVGKKILAEIDVSEVVDKIIGDQLVFEPGQKTFEEEIAYLESIVSSNKRPAPEIGAKCKQCSFRCSESIEGKKSGFHECWSDVKRDQAEYDGPFVFDIWNFRKSAKLMEQGKFLARSIEEEDINLAPRKDDDPGYSSTERQWLQVKKIREKSSVAEIDLSTLRNEVKSWQYPLHFIDFETSMVALPFNKGRRPYEQTAFQFSHHIIDETGKISHAGEFLHREKGKFPNFEFVRALKSELEGDNGTIFRYAAHENTVLCQIHDQLQSSSEPDKDELCAWIETITKSRTGSPEKWEGKRNMIDLCEMIKRYVYLPYTGGSNSIKKVLPAILNASKNIQQKYASPIYGTAELPSNNFDGWQWIQVQKSKGGIGEVKDPYKLLPNIFDGIDVSQLDLLMGSDELADGGAAMTAYAKMQFTEMSQQESDLLAGALLKYCELDTFAMVLLYEYFAEICGLDIAKKAA